MKLSYSSMQTYLTCSEKWRLHYQEGLRSEWVFSSLFFGKALDEAFSALLLTKKKDLTDQERIQVRAMAEGQITPRQIFLNNMKNIDHNGTLVDLDTYPKVMYFISDFDPNLFEVGELSQDWNRVLTKKRSKAKLEPEELELYCSVMLESLRRKGVLMLAAYEKEVLPQIQEVIAIQEKVSLPNGEGDELRGFIDFRCIFVDEPGVIYTVDNKTSSKPYTRKQLEQSEQLAIYSEYTEDEKVAYVVIEKTLRKREPKVKIEIKRAKLREEVIDSVFAQVEHVAAGVKREDFQKDFSKCFQYGRMCEFFKLCKYGDMKDLKKIPPKDEK